MSTTQLVLVELAAVVALLLVIRAVLRHACDPRRDAALVAYFGRHRPRRRTLAHVGGIR